MSTLEDLRQEYERVGLGPRLYELLGKIVWATVRAYPAAEYSPYRMWDDTACEDVLNDWIEERLWGRADLQAMISAASTVKQFRAALTTSLRQYLTNKRRRSIAANLYTRVKGMLATDSAFRSVGPTPGAGQRWTLESNPSSTPFQLSRRELLEVATELSDDDLEVVRYGPYSQKLSPILRKPKLRQFLLHLLSRSNGSLALRDILDVMRLRFSLPTEEQVELDDRLPSQHVDPGDEAVLREGARSVVARLDREEAHLVEAYFCASGDEEAAAQACETTMESVRRAARHTYQMIVDCSDSLEEARSVAQLVESLLHEGGE